MSISSFVPMLSGLLSSVTDTVRVTTTTKVTTTTITTTKNDDHESVSDETRETKHFQRELMHYVIKFSLQAEPLQKSTEK